MDGVIPARNGKSAFRYTWDEDGVVRNIEPLEKVRARTEGLSSHSRHTPKDSRSKVNWPFHYRATSEVPSTPATSHLSHFRRATAQTKSWFKEAGDSASILSRSLVPDYVIHYMRGETPESLAMKRERMNWGERDVVLTPGRERFMSQQAFFEDPFSSQTHLASGEFEQDSRKHGFRRLLTGWRGGVAFNSFSSLIILLAAVVCFAVVASKSQVVGGEYTLFSGSCSTASNINVGLHALINTLSIILLVGGNYVFQVLSSPTRNELTAAHDKKRWLDIGVPSLRNLPHISGFRASLATVILLVAVATQVIYNAVIFTSQTGVDYDIVFVTEPFLSGSSFSNDTESNVGGLSRADLLDLQADAVQSKLVNLTTESCVQAFGGTYESQYDALLLVVETASTTTSVVQTARLSTSIKAYSEASSQDELALDGSLVQYCLARIGSPQTCGVTVSSSLLGVVALLHLATFCSIATVLSRTQFEPLATLGDAIRSFLRYPDSTTKSACLLSKKDVRGGRWGYSEAKYFAPSAHFWMFTPSLPRWTLMVFTWTALAVPTAVALGLVMPTDPQGVSTPFGISTPYTTFLLPSPATESQMALLVCLPQLLLAILYMVTNSHLTTYYVSHELTLFALGPRPLRVSSDPAGKQTTSLFITLPRPISWALLVLFVAMGFTLSQAVFPAVITLSPSISTSSSDQNQIIAVAFSTQALLVLLALLFILIVLVVSLGLRRAPAAALVNGQERGNPLVLKGGSCSAALSAKCHPAPGEVEPWKQDLTWGVVAEGVGMREGRCAFSALSVGAVDVGRTYA
ncbi:putative DUF6536 domain-containing protein [Seiridium unicorne]|uniref:DUF6536 domain-containing protein n=1 Tax=Seiridium unicorne TaxID=138068 RepID=A0ABR2ULU5_9PEZI